MLIQITVLASFISMTIFINRGLCLVMVELSGTNITDIPRDLRRDVTFFNISKTSISILNLTAAFDYPLMNRIDVMTSPIMDIIIPSRSLSVALDSVALRSGTFSTPPDFGIVLAGQLLYLTLSGLGITAIPDNYFQHYSRLKSLDLTFNPIQNLSTGSLAGLRQLGHLYLGHTQVNPLPPLHQWLPNLQRLHAPYTGMTVIPSSFLESLSGLKYLDFRVNRLTLVPRQEHFINLQNMVYVKLGRNPLQCDFRICWIKVLTHPRNHALFSFILF